MAQQLGTVVFGARKLPSLLGQTVAIVGQGSVGLFHDFMLRRLGAHRIIAIEPVKERLDAGRRMGIDEAIDVTGQRATEAVLDLTNGQGADVVVEAVGSVDTFNQTLQLVRPLGRIAVFGLPLQAFQNVNDTFRAPSSFEWARSKASCTLVMGNWCVTKGAISISPLVMKSTAS